jgi:hypothetical protein
MKRWFHNLRRLWSGAEWFYITRLEKEYEILTDEKGTKTLGKGRFIVSYYASCNTSGSPHWYPERRRADTVHKADIKALLQDIDLNWSGAYIWTKEEFDARTKELITDAVFKDIE